MDRLFEAVQKKNAVFRTMTMKAEQRIVIAEILDGKDCIVQLPTGYGKSLLYALPPLLLDEVRLNNTNVWNLADDKLINTFLSLPFHQLEGISCWEYLNWHQNMFKTTLPECLLTGCIINSWYGTYNSWSPLCIFHALNCHLHIYVPGQLKGNIHDIINWS